MPVFLVSLLLATVDFCGLESPSWTLLPGIVREVFAVFDTGLLVLRRTFFPRSPASTDPAEPLRTLASAATSAIDFTAGSQILGTIAGPELRALDAEDGLRVEEADAEGVSDAFGFAALVTGAIFDPFEHDEAVLRVLEVLATDGTEETVVAVDLPADDDGTMVSDFGMDRRLSADTFLDAPVVVPTPLLTRAVDDADADVTAAAASTLAADGFPGAALLPGELRADETAEDVHSAAVPTGRLAAAAVGRCPAVLVVAGSLLLTTAGMVRPDRTSS